MSKSLKINEINFFDVEDMSIQDDKFKSPKDISDPSEKKKKIEQTNKSRKNLFDSFQRQENCIFLTWSWISIESWCPSMYSLWKYFTEDFTKKDEFNDLKDNTIKYKGQNIEEFLSFYHIHIQDLLHKWEDVDKQEEFKNELITEIKNQCRHSFDIEKSEHAYFLQNLFQIRQQQDKPRLKIFTLNYDTLIEEAAGQNGYIIIDGFSFGATREFNAINFDLDIVERRNNRLEEKSYFRKVFHLYKLHWSLDWDKEWNNYFKCLNKEWSWEIIYPWNSKFEQSYNMPYFEMLTRFQSELRKESTVLNIIGYWFGDIHINRMIMEALKNNTSFTINIFWKKTLWERSENWEEMVINNTQIEQMGWYINSKRVNLFNMYFWWLVNLMENDWYVLTQEEKLVKAILEYKES